MNKPAQSAIEAGDLQKALRLTVELKLAALDSDNIHHWYYLDKDERLISELIHAAQYTARDVDALHPLPDRLRAGFGRMVDWAAVNKDALAAGVTVGGFVIALIFAVAYPVGQ